MIHGAEGRGEGGLALLEAALSLLFFLPLVIGGAGLAALMHDQTIFSNAQSEALRQMDLPIVKWKVGDEDNELQLDKRNAALIVSQMLTVAHSYCSSAPMVLTQESIKACVWLISVDASSGKGAGVRGSHCSGIGNGWSHIDMHPEFSAVMASRIGKPASTMIQDHRHGGYLPYGALIGVKIKASLKPIPTSPVVREFYFGNVQLPKTEVAL